MAFSVLMTLGGEDDVENIGVLSPGLSLSLDPLFKATQLGHLSTCRQTAL